MDTMANPGRAGGHDGLGHRVEWGSQRGVEVDAERLEGREREGAIDEAVTVRVEVDDVRVVDEDLPVRELDRLGVLHAAFWSIL